MLPDEQRGDHGARFSSGQGRRSIALATGRGFGEGQVDLRRPPAVARSERERVHETGWTNLSTYPPPSTACDSRPLGCLFDLPRPRNRHGSRSVNVGSRKLR